ncbi:helix-turn-helix transcriptional regulator [Microbacterium luticocti]|uniref:helix-turn-helix transcriptional regulator n=1 Tax=Microbacterium luticocti TaxID=451764 RepID=UPI00048E416F|nr:helix-turn-helix domain-containing protein [Microbacterium luticocti]
MTNTTTRQPHDPVLLTTAEAASIAHVSPRTLEDWRRYRRPGTPPFLKLSHKTVRYECTALLAWLENQEVSL